MTGATATADSEASRDGEPGATGPTWALAIALDCGLTAAPARRGLAQITEVEIGRGEARAFCATGERLRIELADPVASQRHARLVRTGDSWRIEDAGSKNGTRVNGHRVSEAALADGDVIECGETFFVLRRAAGPIADLDAPVGATQLLRTISPAFERELALLPRIARSRVPVLVRGASGTGKDVVAAAIHELSGRSGPMIAVNCGAIPAALVESELFGSRRGAFSGAEDRPGLVRGADGGTLFLDEVAELPPTSQTALLRFLQDGEVLPLGAGKRVIVDARVVAATNRPLEALIADGRFRHDLYARLLGYELHLLPVRARIEDLGILCTSLLARLDDGPERRVRRLSRTVARALFAHDWSMQVRELEQMLRSALATAQSSELSAADLRLAIAAPRPPAPLSDGATSPHPAVPPSASVAHPAPLSDSAASRRPATPLSASVGQPRVAAPLRTIAEPRDPGPLSPDAPPSATSTAAPDASTDERSRIVAALDACAGNQTRAARSLGISRSLLVQKLRLYQIPRPRAR